MIYELGTGRYFGEIDNLNSVSTFHFTSDGEYLVVGTHYGI